MKEKLMRIMKNLNTQSAAILKSIQRYLNGSVNLKFLQQPFLRWGLIALVALYVLVGAVVGWKVYKVKSESTNIRRILVAYPLPAVLMPQDVILVRDYLNQLKFIRHFTEKTKQSLPADAELQQQLLNNMIETRLLLQASRRFNAKVTKADIEAAYQKIIETNGGQAEIEKLLTDLYGMTESEFKLLIRDQLLREKIKKDVLRQVQAKHILIRDEKKAQSILEEVKKSPEKFEELAKQHSEDTVSRENGGDLGFVPRGVLAPAFEEAAFSHKKGDLVQNLVKTDFGFHIIKIVDQRGTVDKKYLDFIADLRKNKKVWIVLR